MRVYTFKPGLISLTLSELPRTFITTLKDKIYALTGTRWTIDVIEEDVKPTSSLMEQSISENEQIKKEFLALPEIQKILKKFPQTKIEVEE